MGMGTASWGFIEPREYFSDLAAATRTAFRR